MSFKINVLTLSVLLYIAPLCAMKPDIDLEAYWGEYCLSLPNEYKNIPLIWAVKNNNFEQLKVLLRCPDSNPNETDSRRKTPLFWAVSNGQKEIVKLLLEYGADVNVRGCFHGSSILWRAIYSKNHEIVQLLLTGNADVHLRDDGYTPLGYYAKFGNVEMVKLLLKYNADVNNGGYKRTPLIGAIIKGHDEIIKLLLALNVDVNKDFNTPLTAAIKLGKKELVETLIAHGADVNKVGGRETPLYAAVASGNVDMVKLLLAHKANINTPSSRTQETALSLAVSTLNKQMVKLLLDCGADVDIADVHGLTPVITAASSRFLESAEILNLLLEKKPTLNQSPKYESPLLLAVLGGHIQSVKYLLDFGVDVDVPGKECKGTPLYWAVRKGFTEKAKLLLANNANVNKVGGYNGESILLPGLCTNNKEIVTLLLARPEIKVDIPNHNGLTPLYHSALYNKVKMATTLLQSNKINLEDCKDALHCAQKENNKKVAYLLQQYLERKTI